MEELRSERSEETTSPRALVNHKKSLDFLINPVENYWKFFSWE